MVAWLCVAASAQGTFVEPDAEVLWTVDGPANVYFGWAVSELGDVDGDGAMDVITAAPSQDANVGATYVYSGATGTLLYTFQEADGRNQGWGIADGGDVDGDGIHDIVSGAPGGLNFPGQVFVYSGATGVLVRTLTAGVVGDAFGTAVANIGDVDGDGYGDLAVGAPDQESTGLLAGRVTLFSGVDGHVLRTIDGEGADDRFGSGLGPIGDVDGDGLDDLVIGARDAGDTLGGRVTVVSSADGAVIVGPLAGAATSAELGSFFVAGVGDVDGDSIPDVYGGDYADGAFGYGSGRAYVFSGADGTTIHEFEGAAGDGLGCGRTARDMDGDGVWDLAIGSYTSGAGAVYAGKVQVFSGVDGSVLRTFTSTTAGETFGFDTVGLGDVDGDGDGDLLVGAATGGRLYVLKGNTAVETTPPTDAGTAPTTPPDTGEVDTDTDVDTGTPPAGDDDDEGCGCASGPSGGWFGVLGLLLVRSRRR